MKTPKSNNKKRDVKGKSKIIFTNGVEIRLPKGFVFVDDKIIINVKKSQTN